MKMDMEYIRRRGLRYKKMQKIKKIAALVMTALILLSGLIWLGIMIAQSKAAKEQPPGSGKEAGALLLSPSAKPTKAQTEAEPTKTQTEAEPTKTQTEAEPTKAQTELEPTTVPTTVPTKTPTPSPTPTPTKAPAPKVAIDAGHGGKDWGSYREGVKEKTVNLAIALEVDRLLRELGYETFLVRSDDTHIDKYDRPGLVQESGADLFVSIHQNALDQDMEASLGTEVWYNDTTHKDNKKLAEIIAKEVTQRIGTKNRGIKVGNNLVVLKTLDIPACLVECAFISSKKDREMMSDPVYQTKIAEGIVAGIQSCLPLPE